MNQSDRLGTYWKVSSLRVLCLENKVLSFGDSVGVVRGAISEMDKLRKIELRRRRNSSSFDDAQLVSKDA